jgi:hypothetical protein
MKNEFVTYEQALALKELGFDEPCLGYYSVAELKLPLNIVLHQGLWASNTSQKECKNNYIGILAPLYQQAFRWFREKHNLNFNIDCYFSGVHVGGNYHYHIINGEPNGFTTYEEAEQVCLDKLIEICKTKQI